MKSKNIKYGEDGRYMPSCPICKGEPVDLIIEQLRIENKQLREEIWKLKRG